MNKTSHTTLLLALFLLTGLLNQQFLCNKKLDCHRTYYNFELGIRAYPDKDSIKVSDTIWLEVNEATTLKDAATGREIDYSGAANLGSALAFHKLSPENRFTIPAADKFELLLVKGVQVSDLDPSYGRQYLFVEQDDRYLFKLGVVAKEQGTYSILFSNANNVYRKEDDCTKAAFGLNFKNTNQHYYLHPFFMVGTTPVGGDYYFKVVP